MQNEKKHRMDIRMSEKEYELLSRKRAEAGSPSWRYFLLKLAEDSKIINYDFSSLRELAAAADRLSSAAAAAAESGMDPQFLTELRKASGSVNSAAAACMEFVLKSAV